MSENDQPTDRQGIVLLAITVEGGLIIIAWILGWILGPLPLEHFTFTALGTLHGVLATIPIFLVFLATYHYPIGPLRRLKQVSAEFIGPVLASCTVIDMLGISILAGLGEEMLFRGVLQAAFDQWMPFWLALVLASVLFGVLHAITPAYAVLATVMGAYLGWLYHFTGNLFVPSLVHALYDFLVLLYLLRGPEGPLIEAEDEEEVSEEEEDE